MRLHPMKDDLSDTARSTVIGLLNSRLADCIDVQTRTRQTPGHVNGPKFSGQNRLFEEINEEVVQNLDNIADRAAQLGGTANGKGLSMALAASLPEYALALTPGRDQVTELADTLVSLGRNVRQAITQSYEYGDGVTANVLTRVSRGVDKWLWMVQAHLQEG
jgi:starvation-inducible DNA-binding protein